jgi:hypothetical protein
VARSNTPDSIDASVATGAAAGSGVVSNLSSDISFVVATEPATGKSAVKALEGQTAHGAASPTTQFSFTSPFPGTQASVFGTTARLLSVVSTILDAIFTTAADPNKLTVVLHNSYLSKIKEKKGIANLSVFDRKTGTKQYQTVSFFATNVMITPSESASMTKTNEGFTLYSPDASPTPIALSGTLLSGDDWDGGSATRPGRIRNTDWFSKLFTDYKQRLSSTAAISNNTDVWFSYEGVFANVFITGMQVGSSADSPTSHGFTMQMIAKKITVTTRADISGSGPDEATSDDSAASEAPPEESGTESPGNTGTAATIQTGGQGATTPVVSSETVSAWSPDGRINPAFIPQETSAAQAAVTAVYQRRPK